MTWVTQRRAMVGLIATAALALMIGPGAVYYVAAQTGRRHGYVTRVTAARR